MFRYKLCGLRRTLDVAGDVSGSVVQLTYGALGNVTVTLKIWYDQYWVCFLPQNMFRYKLCGLRRTLDVAGDVSGSVVQLTYGALGNVTVTLKIWYDQY